MIYAYGQGRIEKKYHQTIYPIYIWFHLNDYEFVCFFLIRVFQSNFICSYCSTGINLELPELNTQLHH